MAALGSQIFADWYGCDRGTLDDPDAIRSTLHEAAQRRGVPLVDRCSHRSSPKGVSGVVIIAESHTALRSWPERFQRQESVP